MKGLMAPQSSAPRPMPRVVLAAMIGVMAHAQEERDKDGGCMTPEHVVIVGRRPEYCEPLSRALAADGWEVRTCAGPARARCPLLSGDDCTLRDSAAAAIVYLNARRKTSIPLVRCAAASSAPSVVVLEGQVDAPRLEGGFAIVGSLRSPEVIAATMGGLFTNASWRR